MKKLTLEGYRQALEHAPDKGAALFVFLSALRDATSKHESLGPPLAVLNDAVAQGRITGGDAECVHELRAGLIELALDLDAICDELHRGHVSSWSSLSKWTTVRINLWIKRFFSE